MILFVYLIVVIVMMSKQKKEGKVVSGWTRFLVYSLLVLSLLSLLASSLAVSLFSLPLLGFLLMAAILEIAYFVRLVIAFGLVLLSLTLYLDSQKSQQPTPLSYQHRLCPWGNLLPFWKCLRRQYSKTPGNRYFYKLNCRACHFCRTNSSNCSPSRNFEEIKNQLHFHPEGGV